MVERSRRKPPVFIVGSPRSGTTLLYHMLLSSGGFAIYRSETQVFSMLAPAFGHFRKRSHRERFLRQWLPSELFLRSGLDPAKIGPLVLDHCHSGGDLLWILMEGIAESQGAERWAECTPTHSLHMLEIMEHSPDARFIHIIRDGRDVAVSMAKQGWIPSLFWDGDAEAAAAVYWDWLAEWTRREGKKAGPERYREVLFEDLLRVPEQTLASLGDFIDHKLDYDRIRRVAIGSVGVPNTSFGTEWQGGTFEPVRRWKRVLSPEKLRKIEMLIGHRLCELGYELSNVEAMHSTDISLRLLRASYRTRFGMRTWLKSHIPGSWHFVGSAVLQRQESGENADPTLRPSRHPSLIRSLVQGRGSMAGVNGGQRFLAWEPSGSAGGRHGI